MDKKFIIIFISCLVLGLVSFFGFRFIQNQQSSSRISLGQATPIVDESHVPTIDMSKYEAITEEEAESLQEQKVALEQRSIVGEIERMENKNLIVLSPDARIWTVMITDETRLINLELGENRELGQFSELEAGMEIKAYAFEEIGLREEFQAEKVIYQRRVDR